MPIDHAHRRQGLPLREFAAAATAFVVYAATLAPSIVGGDSGELAAALATGGIAHPPGYPLYSAVGRAFAALPMGAGAWRTNLLSAVCGAACAGLLCRLVFRLARDAAASWAAAGLFAFSALVWPYAVTTEVFAPNNLLVLAFYALLLDAWVRIREGRPATRSVFFVFLSAGLGASHHTSFVLLAAPALAVFLIEARKHRGAGSPPLVPAALASIFGLCLGLSPFLYLPWLARTRALVAWGDPSSLSGFFTHVLRREYGTFRLANAYGLGGTENHAAAYLRIMGVEILRQTLFLLPLGLWSLSRASMNRAGDARRFLAWATGSGLCLYIAVFSGRSNIPLDRIFFLKTHMRFWQAPFLIMCVWIGAGLSDLFRRIGTKAGFAAAVVLLQIFVWLPVSRQDREWSYERYGKALIGGLPEGAVFVSRGDTQTNCALYVQTVEGFRADVRILDRGMISYDWMKPRLLAHYPDLVLPGRSYGSAPDQFNLAQLIEANASRHPVFLTAVDPSEDATWQGRYRLRPFGFVYQAFDRDRPTDWKRYREQGERALSVIRDAMPVRSGPISYEARARDFALWVDYWNAPYLFAQELLERASSAAKDEDRLAADRVLASLEEALRGDAESIERPGSAARLYSNELIDFESRAAAARERLGFALAARGKSGEAVAQFREAARLRPNDARARTNLGAQLLSAGSYQAAVDELREAARADWPQAHDRMGLALFALGKREEALARLERAVVLDPRSAVFHGDLGKALAAEGRRDEALREYRAALKLHPDFDGLYPLIDAETARSRAGSSLSAAYNAAGLGFAGRNEMEDAVVEFRQALRLAPGFVEAHANLGAALAAEGALAEAVAQDREALRLDPNDLNAACNMGLALAAVKKPEAKKYFDKALALSPRRAELLDRLARALDKQGSGETAESLRKHDKVLKFAAKGE